MASPECQGFHQQSQAIARRHLGVRLSQGTKATTPQILARRWAKHDFKGLPANSTGSRNAPFFENAPQNYKPLDEQRRLTGGVLRNYSYAKYLLKKRRDNVVAQQLAKENVVVPATAPPSLTEADSRNLELNLMLQELSNAITEGNADSAYLSPAELLKALRLLMAYMVDGMNEEELVQFRRFFDELAQEVETLQGQRTISNPKVTNTIQWIDNVNKLLKGFAKDINETSEVKRVRLSKLAGSIFDLSKKTINDIIPKLRKRPQIAPTQPGGGVGAEEFDALRDLQPGNESGYSAQTGTTATGHREAEEVETRRRPNVVAEPEVAPQVEDFFSTLDNARSREEVLRIMRPALMESSIDELSVLWNAISEGEAIKKVPDTEEAFTNRIFNKIKQNKYSKDTTIELFKQWITGLLQ